VNKVLDRFKQEPKMYLDGHCADDFLNGSRKHVLSFIWQVIQRFDQSASGVSMDTWIEKQKLEIELEQDLDRVKSAISSAPSLQLRIVTSSGARQVEIMEEEEDRSVYEVITSRLQEEGEDIPHSAVLLFGGDDVEDATFKQLSIQSAATLELVVPQTSELLEALGFPEEHLTLLQEFLSKPECINKWLEVGPNPNEDGTERMPLTWEAHESYWRENLEGKAKHLSDKNPALLQWVRQWEASCTDASQQRYLKAVPGELISCALDYINQETKSTCIIQFQVAIDFYDVGKGNRGDISEICGRKQSGTSRFELRAPELPGLYMIWSKGSYHYSFRQAAQEQYPGNYTASDRWYGSFIAWLRVESDCTPRPAGPCVRLDLEGIEL